MDGKMSAIIMQLDALATEIIVPLRRKIINEAGFMRLYAVLEEVYVLIEHERQIDRELAAIVFLIYSQLVTELIMCMTKALLCLISAKCRDTSAKYLAARCKMTSPKVQEISVIRPMIRRDNGGFVLFRVKICHFNGN